MATNTDNKINRFPATRDKLSRFLHPVPITIGRYRDLTQRSFAG